VIRGRDWRPSEALARHRGVFLDGPEGAFSFADVGALVAKRATELSFPAVLRPEAGVAGVVDALAALEWGQRAQLLHPRAPGRAPPPPRDPGPGDEILFTTSGSTGRPKRVRLARSALDAAARAHERNLPWQDQDRWLLSIPPAHIGGFSIVVRCLRAGATVVLPDALQSGFRPEAFRADAARWGFSLASLVPTMLHRLDPESWPASLRCVLLGGAPASPALLARFADRPVLTTYGMTEACAQVATEVPDQAPPTVRGVGRVLPGVELRVADGRIQLRGPTLMRGYLGRPSFEPGGWFDTGDRGALGPDGTLHIRGRSDEMIVTGGENVFPQEVEAALAGLEGVEALCVVGIPDPEWGQRVAALYVGSAEPREAAAAAKARLPDFRCPSRWKRTDRLPLGPTGKPSRSAAARAFGDGP